MADVITKKLIMHTCPEKIMADVMSLLSFFSSEGVVSKWAAIFSRVSLSFTLKTYNVKAISVLHIETYNVTDVTVLHLENI